MKVIGKSTEGYLIAATDKEIANLFGFYWAGQEEFITALEKQGRGCSDLVGLTIHPDVAYNRLSWLKSREGEFDRLCKKLRDTADMIQDHRPLFDAIAADKDDAA